MQGIKLNLDKDLLYDLYVIQKKTTCAVAKIMDCSKKTVCNYLHRYNIPVRSPSVAAKGKFGRNAFNWKSGKHKDGGYVYIYTPNHPYARKIGSTYYMAEHRLVMERKIGRYLERWEDEIHLSLL